MIVDCTTHGLQLTRNFVGGSAKNVIFGAGAATNCPICGQMSPVVPGTYELSDGIIRSFRDIPREKIESFLDIIKLSQNNYISNEKADNEVRNISEVLFHIWRIFNKNSGALALLLVIVTTYLAHLDSRDSDVRADKLRGVIERQTQIEMMILQELRTQRALDPSQEARQFAKQPKQIQIPPKKSKIERPANRLERRRSKSLSLKKRDL